jgi:hypothetical protein
MKRLFLILLFALFSCSSDEITEPQQNECFTILSRGIDARGDFIIVKFSDFNNKRYKVNNYQDYININQICDFTNLIEQPL